MSEFDEVKQAVSLKDYAEANLAKARGGLVCPNCGSGTGKSKTPAFSIKGDKWKCFSCDKGGDVFDLAGILNDTDDKTEQLQIVANWASVSLDNNKPSNYKTDKNAQKESVSTSANNDYLAGREYHRAYIAECSQRLRDAIELDFPPTGAEFEAINYLESRGITKDEIVALGIGLDPKPKHGWQDTNGKWFNSPRIILPWAGSDYYHIDRVINKRAKDLKYDKPEADEVGEQPLYNPQAFDHDYVVVVEGVLDAIAIQLCGYNAVALGGTNVNPFVKAAAERNYKGVVIDMLDADGEPEQQGKGRKAGANLATLSAEAGITCLSRAEYGITDTDTYGIGYKDAGEWFAVDRTDLADMLEVMRGLALEKAQQRKEAGYREAMRHLNVKDPGRVALDVLELRNVYEPIPTGIAALDEALGGGISLGETTYFGAVSSYGKTTLAVQIADNIARTGRPVLFVTIEQSAKEIIAKSLSRLVYTENKTGWNIATPSDITSLQTRHTWQPGQKETLQKAVSTYRETIAPNLRIVEGDTQPTVNDIRAIALMMKEHDGQAPIIFIDYLQLLAPASERYDTDKRNADRNVSDLRRLARDLNTHVWCISSLNRSSYSGVISLDSFKESGGIEYGADNLIGLQPRNMAEQLDGIAESKIKREADKIIRKNKSKTERDCELTILKQRNGAVTDEALPLVFKPLAAYFIDGEEIERKNAARVVL